MLAVSISYLRLPCDEVYQIFISIWKQSLDRLLEFLKSNQCITFLGYDGSFGLTLGIPFAVAVFGIILVGIYWYYKKLTSK